MSNNTENGCLWIKEDGQCIKCKVGEHSIIAERWFPDSKNPEAEAEKHWVKVTKDINGRHQICFFRPTQAQKDALMNWCMEAHEDFPFSSDII